MEKNSTSSSSSSSQTFPSDTDDSTWLTCLLFSPHLSSSSSSSSSTSALSSSNSQLESLLSSSSSYSSSHHKPRHPHPNSLSHFSAPSSTSNTFSHFNILNMKCSLNPIELLKIDSSRTSCYESIIILLIFLYLTSSISLFSNKKDEVETLDDIPSSSSSFSLDEVYLSSFSTYTELEYKLSKDLLEKFIGSSELIRLRENFIKN